MNWCTSVLWEPALIINNGSPGSSRLSDNTPLLRYQVVGDRLCWFLPTKSTQKLRNTLVSVYYELIISSRCDELWEPECTIIYIIYHISMYSLDVWKVGWWKTVQQCRLYIVGLFNQWRWGSHPLSWPPEPQVTAGRVATWGFACSLTLHLALLGPCPGHQHQPWPDCFT